MKPIKILLKTFKIFFVSHCMNMTILSKQQTVSYEGKTYKELYQLATEHQIDGRGKKNKVQLIQHLLNHDIKGNTPKPASNIPLAKTNAKKPQKLPTFQTAKEF